MPALPAAPNVLKFDVHQTIGEDNHALTRFHWLYTGSAPSNATCATLAADFQGNYANFFEPLAASTNSITSTLCTDLSSPTSGQGLFTGTDAGSRTGNGLPAGVAFLLNLLIARRYRGGKPRVYLPIGVDGDLQDEQTWASAFISAVQGGWDTFTAAINALSVSGTALSAQVNVSYFQGFTPHLYPSGRYRNIPNVRATPVIDHITGRSGNAKLGSQRRRYLHST